MTTPKYRTDAKACSCPGYWYRRTCRHYRAYGEAMALVVEQDKANAAFSSPKRHPLPLGSQQSRAVVPTIIEGDPCPPENRPSRAASL